MSAEQKDPLDSWQITLQRFSGGVLATLFLFPAENMKRLRQMGYPHPPLSKILREGYRGVFTSLIASPPLAIQILGASHKDPAKLAIAIGSSALILGVAETFILNQQLHQHGLRASLNSVLRHGLGTPFRTFFLIFTRESAFTVSFDRAKQTAESLSMPDKSTYMTFITQASLVGTAALFAHPFDTFATLYLKKLFSHAPDDTKGIYREFAQHCQRQGVRSLFQGAPWQVVAFGGSALVISNIEPLIKALDDIKNYICDLFPEKRKDPPTPPPTTGPSKKLG